ncbi:hypothetical protein JCGZ_24932 [Jatropha curcas]|uniref:Uncharacterized protein n=1 Tax=Jatropha curcas TaxID=180498 RepID=A0A067L119_JATCU|nr:hypothetical protein JCGZ_24932 [Jatropha curcas]
MSGRGSSWGSCSLRNFLQLIYKYRAFSSYNVCLGHHSNSIVAKKIGDGYSMHQGLQMINASGGTWKNLDTNMSKLKDDIDMVRPPVSPPNPPRINIGSWMKWVLGSVLSFFLPLLKPKWEKLKRIEGEAEIVAEEVESVATVVEKVATVAENISADMAEKFPENGKLKKTALVIEKVSKATAHDAELTKDFIRKVDKLKHDFEDLETVVEPVIEKLIPKN